ncbi:MAG: KamA family radical SAM protein, partial [Fimbriimonadaceae bacterium]
LRLEQGGGRPADNERFRSVTRANIQKTDEWNLLSDELKEAIMVVSTVLPFRSNHYVMRELIDWSKIPDDPMYQLTFPQKGMLDEAHYNRMRDLIRKDAPKEEIDAAANEIRLELNPHPAGQMTHNVPILKQADNTEEPVQGVQHKYKETLLFFPSHGQTCHAYCTFCFRWAQFVGLEDLKFANKESGQLVDYLHQNPQVTDVLFTGGDPMIMKSKIMRQYIEPILDVETVDTIRIGTKSVAYWPQRYVTDPDADELLELLEKAVACGKHVAVMGHYSHPVELSTPIAQEAVRRIRSTGANVRMQSPVVKNVNDNPDAWAELWRRGVSLGAIPYYMFVERDTGAKRYFEIPLDKVWEIFRGAYQQVSGMARTVRGPSMSCFPGKCHILGVTEIGGEKAYVLEFLQARQPDLVRRPFFAKYNPEATWYDQLEPFSEADKPFFISPGEEAEAASGQSEDSKFGMGELPLN